MSGAPSITEPRESVLDRAAVEYDTGGPDSGRILHTTDVSSQSVPASTEHVSKKTQLKQKVGEILHIKTSSTAVIESANSELLAPSPDPTGTQYRLDNHPPPKGLDGFRDFAHQPVKTIKAKTGRRTNRELAKNIATADVSHAQDVELVLAQDQLAIAATREEQSSAHQKLEVLKKARQDVFVRWTMDRHVMKIRRLERKPIQPRERADFITKAEPSRGRTDWTAYGSHLAVRYSEKYAGQYIGSFADPPPASQETLNASIEKLLVASTPWQEAIMHIRRIYRWENTNETLVYLASFLFLWVVNFVVSAIVHNPISLTSHSMIEVGTLTRLQLLAIIVQVLRRRLQTQSVERLREKIMRTEDSVATALTLTEQIEKRGDQGWIEPLIEDMGPWLLLQLGDLANLLEVVLNFYEWREPRQSAYTLSILAIACLAFWLTPTWLLVKVVTLSAGLVFFGLFPIGSRYPDYRLLASPAKWLFWNIPNHAEWAIARLQIEGARLQIEGARQEALGVHQRKAVDVGPKVDPQQSGEPSTSSLQTAGKHPAAQDRSPKFASEVNPQAGPTDRNARVQVHGSYKCRNENHSGRLFVTSLGVRFEPAVGVRDQWQIRYDNMHRVEKINRLVILGSGQDLLFVDGHGQSFSMMNVMNRNEVFTQIIGYSNVQWQVVG